MRRHGMWAIVLLGIMGVSAQSSAMDADQSADDADEVVQVQAQNQARLDQARRLAATDEPRKLFVAAGLAPLSLNLKSGQLMGSADAQAWLQTAIDKGSGEPLIAATAVRRCIEGGDCAVDGAVATLQAKGDSDAQLLLMRLAQKQGDQVRAEQALQRALAAPRYDDQLATLVTWLEDATAEMTWPVADAKRAAQWERVHKGSYAQYERVSVVFSLTMLMWQPELQAALNVCALDEPDTRRREQCRGLWMAMADSNTLLLAKAGLAQLARFEQQPEARIAWQERSRQLDWLQHRVSERLEGEDPAHRDSTIEPQVYLHWIAEQGEIPAMRRMLEQQGESLQPPAGWVLPGPTLSR